MFGQFQSAKCMDVELLFSLQMLNVFLYQIDFYVPSARKLVFPLQMRVAQCCVFRYRGMNCKN